MLLTLLRKEFIFDGIDIVKKILYIATTADNRNRLDGETVKCRILRDYLSSIDGVELFCIDTDNWQKHIFKLSFLILYRFIFCDEIIISAADRGAHIVLNFFRLINTRKKITYFVIGGTLSKNILDNKWNVRTYSRIDRLFVEAVELNYNLSQMGISNVQTLSNFRQVLPFENKYKREDNVKFVFYGRVIKEKGVEHAINLINRLINEDGIKCTLDIYGQCSQDYLKKIASSLNRYIQYKGEIVPNGKNEYEVLSSYDIFIFPTEYPGECLPGALIDAYFASLAVVASNWQYATEYIDSEKNGKIFEYKNYEDMYIKTKELIFENNIALFKENSRKLSKKYDINEVLKEFKYELIN